MAWRDGRFVSCRRTYVLNVRVEGLVQLRIYRRFQCAVRFPRTDIVATGLHEIIGLAQILNGLVAGEIEGLSASVKLIASIYVTLDELPFGRESGHAVSAISIASSTSTSR